MPTRRIDHPPRLPAWSARWCGTTPRLPRPWNSYACFRRQVNLPDKPTLALVRLSADSRYVLWVNGRWAHCGPARCDPANQSYDTIDLADLLQAGANCLAVIVHQFGVPTAIGAYRAATCAFLLDGMVETPAGNMLLSTPDGWLSCESTAWRKDVARFNEYAGFQEHFDAHADQVDWLLPEFVPNPDDGWKAPPAIAPVQGHPWVSMQPRHSPLLGARVVGFAQVVAQFTGVSADGYRVADDVAALIAREERKKVKAGLDAPDALLRDDDQCATLAPPPDGQFHAVVLDLGRAGAGHLMLGISQAAGDEIIDILYAQEVDKSGAPVGAGVSADRYRCRSGVQRWETFAARGMRYVMLVFRNVRQPLKIRHVAVRALSAAIGQVGSFECSDSVLNGIYKASVDTLRAGMLDGYIDCPERQVQRWPDVWLQFRAGWGVFGDASLIERAIAQMAQSQTFDGSLHGFPPSDDPHGRTVDGMLAWIFALADHYDCTARKDLLRQHWPAVLRLLDFLSAHERSGDGLLGSFDGFDIVLDSRDLAREPISGTLNLLYLLAVRRASHIAHVIDAAEQHARLGVLADRIAQASERSLWDARARCFRDAADPTTGQPLESVSIHANALAIVAGLHPEAHPAIGRDVIVKAMSARRSKVIAPSPFFGNWVVDALLACGLTSEAIELVQGRWGTMTPNLWEQWDGSRGSRCFGAAAAAPLNVLTRHVLGISSVGAGWRQLRIEPHIGALEFARGTVPTPHGPAHVEWEKVAEDQLAVRVDLPEGVEAQFVSPLKQTRELESGTSEFQT